MSKDEKTTWLRIPSSLEHKEEILRAIRLWWAVNDPDGKLGTGDADALAAICREWSDRERERIRRPEK